MASVWKRLQRVNKRAAKLQYTASYHAIDLHLNHDWRPNKLSIVWTRRSRRVVTTPTEWEPSLKDPLKGSVMFPVPENQTIAVTLFKDSRTNELEDKEWTFLLEDVSRTGKRRRLASLPLNLRAHASLEPTQHPLSLVLTPTTRKICAATLHLTLHCVLLREGRALDDDMQSLASLLSVNNSSDIAPLEELEDDELSYSDNSLSIQQMLDYTQELERLTSSLTCTEVNTPSSMPSLPETPTCPPYPTISPVLSSPDKSPMQISAVMKPHQVLKHKLKPLELKSNLNHPTSPDFGQHSHNTPVQDLLEWCQDATKEYRLCRVTNLTTSFRNGLALCSIIHRYRPDLIDYSGLEPDDAEGNVRVALEASAALGVSQVLTARDLLAQAPDRLAIMTHLFQLRAHFTGNELHVEQLGSNTAESSYLVGRHDTDSELTSSLFSMEIHTRPKYIHTEEDAALQSPATPAPPGRDPPHLQAAGGEGVVATRGDPLGATDFNTEQVRPVKLMSRRQLLDPFASDEEDETPTPTMSTTGSALASPASLASLASPASPDSASLPKPGLQIISRHDELKERARQLLEATKREARARGTEDSAHHTPTTNGHTSPEQSAEARQAALRERARRLIADARAGVVSPTSPLSPGRRPRATPPLLEIITCSPDSGGSSSNGADSSDSVGSPARSEGGGAGADAATPVGDSSPGDLSLLQPEMEESSSYIASEMEALEREQSAIDEQAAALEKQLRAVMETNNNTEEEDRLMCKWFTLVNKKNALLRRQMQLNILEQEEDLSRRCELLARELRQSLGVEEWRKSEAQRKRERLLLHELLRAVNERDRLVREMDTQEKAIEDDDEIERNLSHVEIQRKNNCALQ